MNGFWSVVLVFMFLVSASRAQVTGKPFSVHTKIDWKAIVCDEGRSKARFPADPDRSVTNAGIKSNIPTTQFAAVFPKIAFILIYSDFPAAPPMSVYAFRENYDAVQNGVVATINSKLISKRDIWTLSEFGREIILKSGTQIVQYRLYLVGNRQYQLITSRDASLENDKQTLTDIDRFFGSFQILEKGP